MLSSCRSRKNAKKMILECITSQKSQKKRKNISPIKVSEQISSAKVNNSQPGEQLLNEQWKSNVLAETNQGQNKRFHQSTPEYFNFVPYAGYLNNINNMSFPPMQGYGSGFMQSPPFNGSQFLAPGSASGSAPPQWAMEIMEDIKSIKLSVSKIKNIEKTVNGISSKVQTLETRMKTMETKVTDVENSSTFINGEFEKTKSSLKSASDDVKKLNEKCKNFEIVIKVLEEKNKP